MKTRLTLLLAASAGLLVAACTRSATTATVPTEAAVPESVGSAQPAGDPTMEALGTQLAATQASQQGLSAAGTAGGAVATPLPALASPTPTALALPSTATPIAALPTAVPTTAPRAVCVSPYTVKAGDWIYKIARDCGLQPSAIIAANPGVNPNRLTPGQTLVLPGVGASAPAATAPAAPSAPSACTGSYTVRPGDNLFRIAFNCGFTTEQMAIKNNIPAPYLIYPGQVLSFP